MFAAVVLIHNNYNMKNNIGLKSICSGHIKIITGIFILMFFTASELAVAQADYKFVASGDAYIKVLGTSNLHKWTLQAKDMSCSAQFNFLPGNKSQPQSLKALTFSVATRDLKSGESLLDSRAYTALKQSKFNDIHFVLTSATISPGQKDHFLINGSGDLSIAGVTKQIDIDVDCIVNGDGTITCTSSEKLKMTDYQIKPPVFMFGALRTGNDLTIDFTMTLNK
jgi:polyisoprenoid-binding protein YceI